MNICAVMVTYNRLDRLKISLPQLLAEIPGKVLVVDNASDDGTSAWLAGLSHPKLDLLRLAQNTGGAGGFAAGMAALAPDDPDWMLLLDDDAWPQSGMSAELHRLIPDLPRDTGAVAGAVYLPDGRISEMNRPGWNPFWHPKMIWATLARGNRAGFKLSDSAYGAGARCLEIDNASFVGYLVSRLGRHYGGPPEAGLFIYGDDVLYSLRLRRKGLKLVFAPSLRFTHDCGSMDASFVYRPLWKIYYHCRNGVQIAREAAGPWVFPLALLWYTLTWAKRGRQCSAAERPLYRRMMWQGIKDGLLGRRGRADHIHGAALLPAASLPAASLPVASLPVAALSSLTPLISRQDPPAKPVKRPSPIEHNPQHNEAAK